MVVVYFPALKLLKIRNLEEFLRVLEELLRILQDFLKILEELFKSFQGGVIDNYRTFAVYQTVSSLPRSIYYSCLLSSVHSYYLYVIIFLLLLST